MNVTLWLGHQIGRSKSEIDNLDPWARDFYKTAMEVMLRQREALGFVSEIETPPRYRCIINLAREVLEMEV